MTTANQIHSAAHPAAAGGTSVVLVAGVPWPLYKLLALVIGFVVAGIVAMATASAAPAVLAGAGAGTLAWVILGAWHSTQH